MQTPAAAYKAAYIKAARKAEYEEAAREEANEAFKKACFAIRAEVLAEGSKYYPQLKPWERLTYKYAVEAHKAAHAAIDITHGTQYATTHETLD